MLIAATKENSIEVIYVCHDDGGAERTKGTLDFEIYEVHSRVRRFLIRR